MPHFLEVTIQPPVPQGCAEGETEEAEYSLRTEAVLGSGGTKDSRDGSKVSFWVSTQD